MLRDAADAVADAAPELATELALWSLFTGLQGGWDERLFTAGQSILERVDSDRPLGRFAVDLVARPVRVLRRGCRDGRRTLRRRARDRGESGRPADAGHAGVRVGLHRRLARTRASTARAWSPGCAPRAPWRGWPGCCR